MVQAGRNFAFLTVAAAAALTVFLCAPLKAQDQGLAVTLKTSDGWNLSAQFHPPRPDHLTLILVHGTGASKEIWAELARVLIRSGYGALAFDLRGHGQSTTGPDGKSISWRQFSDNRDNNDFLNMSRDVDAAADYLTANKISLSSAGFVGEGLGGTLALRYAVTHPQISLIALISPGLDYQNVPLLSALRDYGNRPILIVYSQSDRDVANAAPLIYAVAKISAGDSNVTMIPSGLRSDFLFGRTISNSLALWLKTALSAQAAVVSSSMTETSPLDISSPAAQGHMPQTEPQAEPSL